MQWYTSHWHTRFFCDMIGVMRKLYPLVLCLCILCTSLFSTSCSRQNAPISKTGFYFDTVITITLYCDNAEHYIDACFAIAEKYENLFSTTIEGSDVYALNHSHGKAVPVNPDTLELMNIGISYAKESDDVFDVTVGSLSSLWKEAIRDEKLPADDDIKKALNTVSWKHITLTDTTAQLEQNVQIDLGGLAKGYIADKMKAYLLEQGITSGLINLGGNVLAVGPKNADNPAYTIAIQKPFSENGEAIASVKITDQSVVTSGTYQRYFEQDGRLYHHIIDLSSGYPCENELDSVTIICDQSVDGDALSTTVFLMGLKDGMAYVEALPDTEAIFIRKDGGIQTTSGIGEKIPFQKIK